MPDVQALADTIRSHYHCDGTYLSTPYEAEVLVATVTADAVQPVFALDISVDSGDPADVQEDMEIEVLRSGAFVGRLRVAAGAATSDTLQVNEVSDTRIKVLAGDTVRVLLSFRIRDKLVAASATFDKDSRIAYSDQNENVPPLVNDGGHYAAKWRGVPVDVVFHGDLSLMIDFNSNGPLNHSYTVYGPDSIDVYDTSTDEVPTFNFDAAGTYWVRHVAEDDTTGATQTKWSAVILDDTPIPVRINGLASSVDDPWTLSFRALNGASLARLPRGGMVILHEDESTGSAGNRVADRSRVKGIFFLLNENAKPIPNAGELTFNAISPLGILSRLPGFSQELEIITSGSIDNWQEYELGLTTNALLVYLFRWHTTYASLFDVVLPLLNYPYRAFTVQQQTPYDQMVEIADAVEAYARADRSGAMLLRQHLNLLGDSRDSADVLFHFTPRDGLIEDINIEHRPRVSYMLYRMFSGDQPLESESGVPNEAAEFNTVERKIGVGQSGFELSANERCGWNYALQNHTYFGLPVPRLTVLHPGSYDFLDPAYDNWVLWSGTFEVAGRVYEFDADRFWIESVEVVYEAVTDDYGVTQYKKMVRAVYVGETDGYPGITKEPDNDFWLPAYTPAESNWDFAPLPMLPWNGLRRGQRHLCLIHKNGRLSRTLDFDTPSAAGGPSYATDDLSAVLGESCLGWAYDARSTPNNARGWAVTPTGIYYLSGIGESGTPTATLLYTFAASSDYRSIDASWAWETGLCVMVSSYYGSSGGVKTLTTRNGTFSDASGEVTVNANYQTIGTWSPGVAWSPHVPGMAFTTAFSVTAAASNASMYRTTNYGASWSTYNVYAPAGSPGVIAGDEGLAGDIHIPFHNNASSQILLFGGTSTVTTSGVPNNSRILSRTPDDEAQIAPSGYGPLPDAGGRQIATAPQDRTRIAAVVNNLSGSSRRLIASTDDAGSWTILDDGTSYRRVAVIDSETMLAYGDSDAIGYGESFEALDDRTGNLAVGSEIIGVTGF